MCYPTKRIQCHSGKVVWDICAKEHRYRCMIIQTAVVNFEIPTDIGEMIDSIRMWSTESKTWENKTSRHKMKQIAMLLATRPN
eukprot:11261490-Heterocapsa_arctica.AAC.1